MYNIYIYVDYKHEYIHVFHKYTFYIWLMQIKVYFIVNIKIAKAKIFVELKIKSKLELL